MADKSSTRERPPDRPLKMKDLVQATSVPKSTILHYLKEGLLPEPMRIGINVAYYDQVCVERISFIKEMQTKHRLPLAAIKGLLKARDKGREVRPLIELQEALFGRHGSRNFNLAAYCRATGFSPREVEIYRQAGLILTLEEGRFDREDVAIGRLLRWGRELGLTPEDWAFYPRLAGQIVAKELELRRRYTKDLPFEQDALLTLEFTRAGRAIRAYVIDRVFQLKVVSFKGLKGEETNQDK